MRVQQGLEGPLDLRPLTRSVLWMGQTHTHTHTCTHRRKSYQPSHRYDLLFLMVERADGLLSDVFSSESLWLPYRSSSFSVTLHEAAPSPRAAFSICKSNLLFVLWFCRQCSSILFPAPPPLTFAYRSPHIYTPSPAFCMADNHHHPHQPHAQTPVCQTISTDTISLRQIGIG